MTPATRYRCRAKAASPTPISGWPIAGGEVRFPTRVWWRTAPLLYAQRKDHSRGPHLLEYNPSGNETPLLVDEPALGGQESLLTDQETLRGYGAGRFIDNNLAVANVEVRTRVWDHDIFGTHGILELAPFFDIGRGRA